MHIIIEAVLFSHKNTSPTELSNHEDSQHTVSSLLSLRQRQTPAVWATSTGSSFATPDPAISTDLRSGREHTRVAAALILTLGNAQCSRTR